MADIFKIPTNSENASFKIRTDLEGATYVLRMDWNERAERWCLSIFDADETPILMGVPMNINMDLWGRFRLVDLPPGILMLYDTTGRNEEAGRDDLGDKAVLIYREAG